MAPINARERPKPMNSFFQRCKHKIIQFQQDQKGNMAILGGVSLIMLAGAATFAVDTVNASANKTRLDKAAQAAAVAAVNYASANASSDANYVTNATSIATSTFSANLSGNGVASIPTPTVTVSSTSATVAYSTSVGTTFGSIVGMSTIPISGSATAGKGATTGAYINFYFLQDISDSMNIPYSKNGQAALYYSAKGGNCVLACHGTAGGPGGPGGPGGGGGSTTAYAYATQTLGLTLRTQIAASAIAAAITQAATNEGSSQFYKVGVWGFRSADNTSTSSNIMRIDGQGSSTSLSSNLSAISSGVANGANIPQWTGPPGGSTPIYETLSAMATIIQNNTSGTPDGSAAHPFNYLILATDGVVDDQQSKGIQQNSTDYTNDGGGENLSSISSSWCSSLITSKGIKMATLNVSYPTLYYGASNDLARASYAAPGSKIYTDVQTNMLACASSSALYATATALASATDPTQDPLYTAMSTIMANTIIDANGGSKASLLSSH